MRRVFISQPMRDKTDMEILVAREEAKKFLEKRYGEEFEIIDSFIKKEAPIIDNPVWCLGRSLQMMADADLVLFMPNWETARGCVIEHKVTCSYGIPAIEMKEFQ